MTREALIAALIISIPTSVLLVHHLAPIANQELRDDVFKVVDSYHGCDIIRYTDDTNRWHYFMNCDKSN